MQNLPTDSLYKFCALSGILILLASVYFPIKMDETLNSKMFETRKKIDQLRIEQEYLKKHLDNIADVIEADRAIQDFSRQIDDEIIEAKKKEKQNIDDLIKKKEEYVKKFEEMLKKHKESLRIHEESVKKAKSIELKSVETEIAKDEIVRLDRQLDIVWRIGIAGDTIGILLAFYGFLSWYFKIQVYQDRMIKRQAEERQNNL